MSEARVNNLSNESNSGGPTISGITTFSSPYFFIPPVGNTAERPDNPEKGSIRFNTDSKHLEYFKGDTLGWVEVEASNEEMNGGYRGFACGGGTPTENDTIDYITISTLGNAIDFGNLFSGRYGMSSCASRTRALNWGGYGSNNDTIDYFTMSSLGNSVDFGNSAVNHKYGAALSNQTRGCCGGSYYPAQVNTITYVTIASTGDSKDFGDMTIIRGITGATQASNATRGIFAGGHSAPVTPSTNVIDYITIASKGDAADFGDLLSGNQNIPPAFNGVRAVFGGGYSNVLQYITTATTGNAVDFGDLTYRPGHPMPVSGQTRGVWMAGKQSPEGVTNIMEYIEIMTLGNSKDFGDATVARNAGGSTSNGHGGLG